MNLISKCSLDEQKAMWNQSFSLILTVQVNEILAYRKMPKEDWIDYQARARSARARGGLRAESARAFTGRWCPHSGMGEDLLTGQPDFFTETAVTPERKVKKSFPRSEINRHAKG